MTSPLATSGADHRHCGVVVVDHCYIDNESANKATYLFICCLKSVLAFPRSLPLSFRLSPLLVCVIWFCVCWKTDRLVFTNTFLMEKRTRNIYQGELDCDQVLVSSIDYILSLPLRQIVSFSLCSAAVAHARQSKHATRREAAALPSAQSLQNGTHGSPLGPF